MDFFTNCTPGHRLYLTTVQGNTGKSFTVGSDCSFQHIFNPHKMRDPVIKRSVKHLICCCNLYDPAVHHNCDAISQYLCFCLVMRNMDYHQVGHAVYFFQQSPGRILGSGVKGAQRLIQQQHIRLNEKHARKRNPLLFTP